MINAKDEILNDKLTNINLTIDNLNAIAKLFASDCVSAAFAETLNESFRALRDSLTVQATALKAE
jgi:hypothetical protein